VFWRCVFAVIATSFCDSFGYTVKDDLYSFHPDSVITIDSSKKTLLKIYYYYGQNEILQTAVDSANRRSTSRLITDTNGNAIWLFDSLARKTFKYTYAGKFCQKVEFSPFDLQTYSLVKSYEYTQRTYSLIISKVTYFGPWADSLGSETYEYFDETSSIGAGAIHKITYSDKDETILWSESFTYAEATGVWKHNSDIHEGAMRVLYSYEWGPGLVGLRLIMIEGISDFGANVWTTRLYYSNQRSSQVQDKLYKTSNSFQTKASLKQFSALGRSIPANSRLVDRIVIACCPVQTSATIACILRQLQTPARGLSCYR
jgi:hypothetical protein